MNINWKTYKLGDISKFQTGKLNSNAAVENGKYPFFTCSPTTLAIDDYAFDKEAILLAGNNAEGNFSIKYFKGKFNAYQRTYIIETKNDICDIKFLFYALKICLHQFKQMSQGTSTKFLTAVILNNFEISLPSLEEQRKIAGILGAIDDKIENNRRINTNLELQAQALFEEWLSRTSTTKGVFNDIIKTTIAGDWGQENKQGNYTHEVFCIRGADIPTLRNGDKGKMPIRYILEKNYNTKQLQANDIVVEISGGSPTQSTGRVCMVTQSLLQRLGKDLVCTNFCRAITPKDNYAIFIFLYWQMLYNKNTMFSYENGTTGIKNFNIVDFISKEEIEIPSSNDVEKLNEILQPMYNQIYANGLQNETLATLRDTLLPKLMNGEIKL